MSLYDDDRDAKVVEFLQAIVRLEEEYQLTLSHEDYHGGFIVEPYDPSNVTWLLGAADATDAT